jgi:GntR family transcriptional regulator, uxu operon transcriptional repressor
MPVPSTSRHQSDQGTQRIRDFILHHAADESLAPGARLPTERELVRRFSVPRNAVRRALARLEAEGSIVRRVGRGTFLATSANASPLIDSTPDISPAELIEARLRLEPAMVELVVVNATAGDFERMEACLDRAERAPTLDGFELWDAALHHAIAGASHNRFVLRIFDIVTAVRRQAEWGKLKDRIVTPGRRIQYQEEHREIVAALKERDAERARSAITHHLQNARSNLFAR